MRTTTTLYVPVLHGAQSHVPESSVPSLSGLPMLLLPAGPMVAFRTCCRSSVQAGLTVLLPTKSNRSEQWESLLFDHMVCGRATS